MNKTVSNSFKTVLMSGNTSLVPRTSWMTRNLIRRVSTQGTTTNSRPLSTNTLVLVPRIRGVSTQGTTTNSRLLSTNTHHSDPHPCPCYLVAGCCYLTLVITFLV